MKRSVSLGVVLSAVVCLAYGCGGDDDDSTSSPHAGSAGKGGKGGAEGSAAKGGSAGRGGWSGNGGTAGTPRGGSSGRGGTAGDAGNAGRCTAEEPAPLAECPEVKITEGSGRTIETSCGFEATCDALHCGEPWSAFDAAGCYRPACTASSQCGDDQRCIAGPLVGSPGCTSAVYEGCDLESDCSCSCSVSADCGTHAYCLSAADYPPSGDCPLPRCEEVEGFLADLQRWTQNIDRDNPTDVEIALLVCEHRVTSKRDDCIGQGGEGGGGAGGQGGTGAGGQSGAGGHSGGGVGGH